MLAFLQRWRQDRIRRAAIAELRAMGAGQLGELGIRPDQVEDYVAGCLTGEVTPPDGSELICHSPLCCPRPA